MKKIPSITLAILAIAGTLYFLLISFWPQSFHQPSLVESAIGLLLGGVVIILYRQSGQLSAQKANLRAKISQQQQTNARLQENETILRELYEITAQSGLSFEDKMDRLLKMGCRRLGLEIGIISHIQNDSYQVIHVYAPGVPLKKGDRFSIAGTFCEQTIIQTEPVGFIQAKTNPKWNTHPAYQAFELESYLGTVLWRGSQKYGTLNFSSPHPRPDPFTNVEKTLIKFMAQWVSNELERQQAEAALKESEERLHSTLASMDDLVFVLDEEGRFIDYFQPAQATALYTPPEIFIGKLYQDILPPEVAQQLKTALETVKQTDQVASFDYSLELKDKKLWFSAKISARKDQFGQFAGVTVVARNITQRKRVEQELKHFFTLSIDMLCIASTDGYFKRLNPAFEETLGFTTQELRAKPFLEFVHPEDQAMTAAEIAKLEQGNITLDFEVRFRHKNGGYRWLAWNAAPVAAEGLLYAVARDVTDTRQAQQELEFRNTVLRTQQEASLDGILVVDHNKDWIFYNQRFMQMWGLTPAEAEQGNVSPAIELIRDKLPAPEKFVARIEQIYQSRQEKSFDEIALTDGRIFERYSAPMVGPENKFYGRVWYYRDITERKEAEKALRENETKLRLFVEHTPAAVAMFDRHTRYILASQRWLTDYNLTGQEIIGRSHYEVFPEIPERWKEIHRRCLTGVVEKCEEDPFPRADGSLDWIHWEIHPWYENEDQVGGIIMFTEVITERKRAEEALRESEERLRAILDNSPAVIYLKDKEGRYVMVNRQHAAFFDTTPDAIQGQTDYDLLGPEIAKGLRKNDQKILKAKTAIEFEERVPDGEQTRIFLSNKFPLYRANGEPHLVCGISTDITERKQMEEDLRRSEKQIRTILNTVVDGVITIDETGCIQTFNLAAERIFGYSAETIIGQNIRQLVPEPYKSEHDRYIQTYLQTGQAHIIGIGREVMGQRRDGSTFPMELAIDEFQLGERRFFTGITRDITERKAAQAQQAQLLKELASANQELKDFAYVVSHDLKAPLRAIGSLSSWLLTDYRDKLDDEGQELIRLLVGRAKRMEKLIEGVLQYSRVGRVREKVVQVDLESLVPEIIELLDPPESIQVTIKDKLPCIRGEATRIEQIFQNLLSNAIKFMDKADGQVAIGCRSLGPYWKFTVTDNGPGIEEKYFGKIFQIFQTLTARDEFESSGVGLSVVKKIVEMYGGTIQVESEVGQGTTFTFTLPKKLKLPAPNNR